ncbi:MAG: LysE family translocator [Anaerolineae bacterium]
MVGFLLRGLGYGFTAAVQPGPFQTYVVSRTLQRGWRRALPTALAPLISDGPIILLALFVLDQLPTGWQPVLHIAGALFIFALGWGAYRAWRDFDLIVPMPNPESVNPDLLKAALMNALSPGPYLFWGLVTGPILLEGWREAPSHGIVFLVGFYAAMVCSLVLLIVVFGAARRLGPKVNRALVGLSAVALVAFGVAQLWQGIAGFTGG